MTNGKDILNRVILVDGTCKFCNSFAKFIASHDPEKLFSISPLQSSEGKDLLMKAQLQPEKINSVILIEDGTAFQNSEAGLRILMQLRGFHFMSRLLLLLPKKFRDFFYNLISRNRFIFGRINEECKVDPKS